MQQTNSLITKRLNIIREKLGFTIETFSKLLDFPDYEKVESGKIELSGLLVMKLLQTFSINPLWLYAESTSRFVETSKNTVPKLIVVNEVEEEKILLVNQKASAGYTENIQEEEWYKDLPSMNIPLPDFRNATYRGFQVKGDSMLPTIYSGDWVIGKAVPSIAELYSGKIYIVVLQDSVLVKQVIVTNPKSKSILLRSTNPEYKDIILSVDEVQELWEVNSRLTFSLNVSNLNYS